MLKGISLKRPVPLCLIAAGFGATATAAIVGVPKLWSQEAAGWASAIATTVAVVAALWIADEQIGVARDAAASERETALQVQAAQDRQAREMEEQRAIRLAHAFTRELSYARRHLIVALINWEPARFGDATPIDMQFFASEKPFPDLRLLTSFSGRLEGFSDEDAFAILGVLASWDFYNSGPGINAEEISAMGRVQRMRAAESRSQFGFELLDAIESLINRLAVYYEGHPSVTGIVAEPLPHQINVHFELLNRARADRGRKYNEKD
ncbi:hypothetical protein [Xanthomonas sp. BRIP62411]|uniref:hypothetical protein n=1 Tax=Xanthomonas sp. BRIP62411 TaxID=2182389 RepID=UPI000F8F657D|nr:hypothetical protein [Xanthomonas sp. BRIP62411]